MVTGGGPSHRNTSIPAINAWLPTSQGGSCCRSDDDDEKEGVAASSRWLMVTRALLLNLLPQRA